MNTSGNPPIPNEPQQRAPDSVDTAEDRVGQAANRVKTAAESVESSVSSGIQPDIRAMRNLSADLRDTVSIAFRRIFWAVMVCIALNVVVLVVVLTR